MKGRQKAMVLGAFLSALGTQAAWADDNRAVPRDGGSDSGSSVGASHHSSGGSGWDSSSSSGSSDSSYGSDSSSYAASASFADDNRAVPRGGGSGGGSSAGSGHHSGGSSSGSSGSSSSGDSSSSSTGSSHHSRPPQTDAQRRKPTPGTGTGWYKHGGYYPYYGYGYGYPYNNYYWNYGYYWSPWYYPSYGWYGGYGPYGYGPGYGGGYGGGYQRSYDNAGAVRVMVEPRKTKVYVDDHYAGIADDFDGMFQRLDLSAGRHDITLRLDGYETHRVKLYVPVGNTLKIKYEMVKGSGEKVSESTVGDPIDEARYSRDPEEAYENTRDHRDETRPDNRGDRGTVRLEVSPEDASIYVDGVFRGTGSDLRKVTLPEGRHRLEVVRPGYRTLERDVDVTAGEVEVVEVELPRS